MIRVPIAAAALTVVMAMLGPCRLLAPVFTPVLVIDARPVKPPTIMEMLNAAADRYKLPRELLRDRAFKESRLDPNADDGHGCIGILGLNTRFFHGARSWSVERQINAGAKYLAEQFRACRGNWRCAEWAYRSGSVRR